jgi:hypothetical protein
MVTKKVVVSLFAIAVAGLTAFAVVGCGDSNNSESGGVGAVTGGIGATVGSGGTSATGSPGVGGSNGSTNTAATGGKVTTPGQGGKTGTTGQGGKVVTAGKGGQGGKAGTTGTAGNSGGGTAGSGGNEKDEPCTGDKGADAVVQSYTQQGQPPSGPIPIVIETEPTLAGYTIYRPKELKEKYPQFVFMDGSCTLEGVGAFSEILSEVASYGFIAVVVGNPVASGMEAMGTDPTSMLKPLDWLYSENDRPCSKYYHKILKNKAASSGQSCGGVHAIGAGTDPRVATVVPMNSAVTGMATGSQAALDALHGSIAYLIGGSSDMAYTPSQGDWPALPASLPAWYGNFGNVGHYYVFGQDNGGEFGRVAVAWLRWQLKGETGADTKGLFVGASCGLCSGTDWVIESRNLK